MTTWQLQDAKNRFSAVVEAALTGEPQEVTRRGKPVVVVVAFEEYQRLCKRDAENTPSSWTICWQFPGAAKTTASSCPAVPGTTRPGPSISECTSWIRWSFRHCDDPSDTSRLPGGCRTSRHKVCTSA